MAYNKRKQWDRFCGQKLGINFALGTLELILQPETWEGNRMKCWYKQVAIIKKEKIEIEEGAAITKKQEGMIKDRERRVAEARSLNLLSKPSCARMRTHHQSWKSGGRIWHPWIYAAYSAADFQSKPPCPAGAPPWMKHRGWQAVCSYKR